MTSASSSTVSFSVSGRQGFAVAKTSIPSKGTYTMKVTADGGQEFVIAVGPSIIGGLVGWILGGLAVGALLIGGGIAIIIVVAVKRTRRSSEARRRAAAEGQAQPVAAAWLDERAGAAVWAPEVQAPPASAWPPPPSAPNVPPRADEPPP